MVFLLFLLPVQVSVVAQVNLSTDAASAKSGFETSLSAVDDEYSGKLRSWPEEYLRELDILQKKVQGEGDLDKWQAVNKEILRFKSEKFIQVVSANAAGSDLSALQKKYQQLSGRLEAEMSRKIISLVDKYVAELTAMQKNLTIAGKIDEAVAVNSEIKRVKVLPKVSAAEFALMTLESGKEPEKKVAPNPAEPVDRKAEVPVKEDAVPPVKAKAAAAKVPAEAASIDTEPKVYDGQALPVVAGVNFKNILLSGTDRLRVSKTVCVSASVAKKSGVTSSSSTTSYVATHERSGSNQHFVRVTIRTGNASTVLENSRMIIQIFSKNISGKGGYSELRSDAVDLPKLEGGKGVTVECQPVVTSMKSVRSLSSYSEYLSSASNTGKDFYGIIVSVFDDTGTLIYQGASSEYLEKAGISELHK